jgi:hypothetical protein
MKIEMMIMIVMMMMTEMLMKTDLLKKTVLCFHVTGKMSITFAIVLGCNHQSAQLMVAMNLSIKSVKKIEQRHGHSLTTILKCCMHHPNSLFNATKPSMSNEENQQPEHVSINTSTSELSCSSSSSKIPTRKGWAFSVSGKEEAFRAQTRIEAQRKNELSSKFYLMMTHLMMTHLIVMLHNLKL